jgi:hypothetical protein
MSLLVVSVGILFDEVAGVEGFTSAGRACCNFLLRSSSSLCAFSIAYLALRCSCSILSLSSWRMSSSTLSAISLSSCCMVFLV